MVGKGMALLLAAGVAGCLPTVELGSNASNASSSGAPQTSGPPASTGPANGTTGAPGSTADSSTAGDSGSQHSTAAVDEAGEASSSSDGLDGSSSSSTGAGLTCQDAFPANLPCLECAELECCDEIDLCLGQQECANCFLNCVQAATPPPMCQTRCAPTSGIAAVVTCLALACVVSCPG